MATSFFILYSKTTQCKILSIKSVYKVSYYVISYTESKINFHFFCNILVVGIVLIPIFVLLILIVFLQNSLSDSVKCYSWKISDKYKMVHHSLLLNHLLLINVPPKMLVCRVGVLAR
jgi:hypothetical protein